MSETWYRNCAICWTPVHQCNGFVVGNPLVDPKSARELCGICAILFMPELRGLMRR